MITQQDIYQITPISKKNYKLIPINLNKQQKLNADPKAINKLILLEIYRAKGATLFFIIEEAKKTILDFSKGTFEVL